jgi:hypothetical protein
MGSIAKYYFIFLVFLFLFLNYGIEEINDSQTYFWANLHFLLHLSPLFMYFYSDYKKDTFPLMGLVGLFLALSYSFPIYFFSTDYLQLGKLNIKALEYSFYAYAIFYFTFYAFKGRVFVFNKFSPLSETSEQSIIVSLSFMFLSIYLFSKFPFASGLNHLGILSLFLYLGFIIGLIKKKANLNTFTKIVFWIILVQEFSLRLFDGLVSAIAIFSLFLIIIFLVSTDYRFKASLPVFIVIITVLSFYIIISPIKAQFRSEVWYSGKEFSVIERIDVIRALYLEEEFKNKTHYSISEEEKARNNFFWRYSYQLSALSLVISETPSNVPFWNGETYILFSKFIPRIIWPYKPKEDLGYVFGVRYGIIDFDNLSTSMNTPITAEMYMNFGFWGLLLGPIILAFLYLFLNEYFNSRSLSFFNRILGICFVFTLLIHESNFSLTFGNIPLLILAVYFIINSRIKHRVN